MKKPIIASLSAAPVAIQPAERRPPFILLLLTMAILTFSTSIGYGDPLTWDSSGANAASPVPGAGTWNTTNTNWSDGESNVQWNNANNAAARFEGDLGVWADVTLGENITVDSLSFLNTSGQYTLVGGGNTLNVTSGNITANRNTTLSAELQGTNGLTSRGWARLTLSAGNSYTGDTIIEQGTLEVRASTALPSSTTVTVGTGANNAILQMRANATVAGLTSDTTGSATIRTTADSAATQVLTINSDLAATPSDSTFSGVLENPSAANVLALTKTGARTLTLTGNSTYSGATTVAGGGLIVDGDNSGATGPVSVSGAGSRLGGSGTIGGNTTINPGATLSPGSTPGELSFSELVFAGDLELSGASILEREGGDVVVVDGALSLSSDWTLRLGTGFVDGGSAVILTYDTVGTFGPDALSTDRIDASALGFTPSSSLTLTDTGSAIVLEGVSVIPEPSSVIMLLLGTVIVAGFLRQKRL